MQIEEAERQVAQALASAPHHVQLEVERRALPDSDALGRGLATGRLSGRIVAVFRSVNGRLEAGQPLEIVLPHCMPAADTRCAVMGGFTILHDDIADAAVVEAILDGNLAVTCALVEPLAGPTAAPHFSTSDIDW